MTMRTLIPTMLLVLAANAWAAPGDDEYREGRRHYDLREWDQAIASFKEAYRLRSDAASLFNIAQSYRLKGDCASALGFYKTFKRNFSDEKNIATVDQLITEVGPCAQQQAKSAKTEPTQPHDRQPL